jgi:hypothetical protein
LEPKQSTLSEYSRTRTNHMVHLTSTKKGSWKKDLHRKKGVDYEDTSPPTTKWDAICTLFSMETHNGWKIHQMDANVSFLNGDLERECFHVSDRMFFCEGTRT